MRIIDRYILKNIVFGYIFILLVFVGLYFVIDVFSNLSDMLKSKPQISSLIAYYLNMIPLIFLRVSPLSLLISGLYTFGELNKNNEIISLRASGISIPRIILPVFLFALLLSASSIVIQEKILIYAQSKVEDIKLREIKKDISVEEEKNFAFRSKNKIFFVSSFKPKEGLLKDVIIFEEDENRNIAKKIMCKRIDYKDDKWVGDELVEYPLDSEGNVASVPLVWKEKMIELNENPQNLTIKKGMFSEYASLKDLRGEILRLKKVSATGLIIDLIIDSHKKVAEPFSHLFLIIGVLPFALEIKKKKVVLSSLGIGFIFSFIYYTLFSFGIALGKTSVILPYFAAWLAPLFFLTVGITGLTLLK